MADQLIEDMKAGKTESLLGGLSHKGAIYRINAICLSVLTGNKDIRIIDQITGLKEDTIVLDGYSVSDYAIAALSLMGIEQYHGEDPRIIALVNSGFSFLKD